MRLLPHHFQVDDKMNFLIGIHIDNEFFQKTMALIICLYAKDNYWIICISINNNLVINFIAYHFLIYLPTISPSYIYIYI